MLARHRYTRCVNDVGLDAAHLEPARHPEAVTASLEGDCNALDPASCFLRFLSPSMQQLQQCALVDRELFQRLALDARHDTGNEPARQAHLNDRNQRAVRFEGGEGSAQVVQLLHGGAPSVHIGDDGMLYPRRRPIASSIMGFEDGVEQSLPRPCHDDFGNGLEAISLCDFGSFSLFAGNWPHGIFGVFQHYLPNSDIGSDDRKSAVGVKSSPLYASRRSARRRGNNMAARGSGGLVLCMGLLLAMPALAATPADRDECATSAEKPDVGGAACSRIVDDANESVAERVEAFKSRGRDSFNRKEYDRAIADYSEAVKLSPKD